MSKPINVEAQRIAKILDDTNLDIQALQLLSSDMFQELGRRYPEEETLKATYGPEIGAILWSEKEAEEKFESLNTIDQIHMEKYDSENFMDEHKPLAYQNQRTIEKNIPRLVRIFRREDMRNRILKDFKDSTQKNETGLFLEQFKQMRDLWYMKLCTSLEEHNRNQEQLQISTKRVTELQEQLEKKKTELD